MISVVANQPQIGTTQRLAGNSFTVIMVDLDIPTNNTGQTTTLLHWMQTGLALSPQASRVGRVGGTNDASGNTDPSTDNTGVSNAIQVAFLLRNTTGQVPAAAYISPNPPARLPLSHTYAQFLVDTSGLSAQSTAMQTLANAAKTRQGFNLQQVLQQAGLSNKLVAANFFNVTNPGPVQAVNGNGNGNGNSQQQQQGTGASTESNSTLSGSSSSSSTTSTTSTTYGSGGTISDSSSSSSSTTSASGNNVVKANAASLSVVSGPVVVLVGIVSLFFAL